MLLLGLVAHPQGRQHVGVLDYSGVMGGRQLRSNGLQLVVAVAARAHCGKALPGGIQVGLDPVVVVRSAPVPQHPLAAPLIGWAVEDAAS